MRANYNKAKKELIQEMLSFAAEFKAGNCCIPKAVELLYTIRNDITIQTQDMNKLYEDVFQQKSETFQIRKIFREHKDKRDN